jgi:penicillin-binding protein 1B
MMSARWRRWAVWYGLAAILMSGIAAVGVAAVGWYCVLPASGIDSPTIKLEGDRGLIAVLHPTHRVQQWVPLERMPPLVIDAVVAAEDRRFWSHLGVDPVAVMRAVRANISHGGVREGASTITQQLARTLFLDGTRTWRRKIGEAMIALWLEARYSKARILEAYLNSVYLGHDGDVAVYGLPAAARRYFGKEIGELEVREVAWLASSIRAPNRLLNAASSAAKARRDNVIEALERDGALDARAARRALDLRLERHLPQTAALAPYFLDVAAHELAHRADLPESGESIVHSTLSLVLQRAAERVVRDGIARIENRRPALEGRVQAAVVALEPASGAIRALVGGRNYRTSAFNRATRALRQPGSLFKPFVYVAAFEAGQRGRGLTAASLLPDERLVLHERGQSWEPHNIDNQFHGSVTVRRALEESLNVPAVRVAMDVGPRRVAGVARDLGIAQPLSAVPSLALGTSEVTLLEITAAYAALANGGVRVVPTTLDAQAQGGLPLQSVAAPTRAVSPESAFMISHLLRGVMRRGTGSASAIWGLQDSTAGKTGTTDGLRDAWFVGYTPDLVVGVWVGIDDGSPLGLTGSQAALWIWGPIMQSAIKQWPPHPFTPPPGIILADVDRRTGRPVSFWCGSDDPVQEAFRVGMVPPDDCSIASVGSGLGALFHWAGGLFAPKPKP